MRSNSMALRLFLALCLFIASVGNSHAVQSGQHEPLSTLCQQCDHGKHSVQFGDACGGGDCFVEGCSCATSLPVFLSTYTALPFFPYPVNLQSSYYFQIHAFTLTPLLRPPIT